VVPQDPARQELEEQEELDGASELQSVPGCRAAEQRMGGWIWVVKIRKYQKI